MKQILIILSVILVGVAFFLLQKNPDNSSSQLTFDNSLWEEKGSAPKWLQILPENEWNDIEQNEDVYSYKYKIENTEKGQIERVLEYTKNKEGGYEGVLTLSFSATEEAFVVEIPKSFATDTEFLEFSVDPSRIINPDPVVEFSQAQGDIIIKSKETVTAEDIESSIEQQLIDTEFKRCEKLGEEESYICGFSLIAKYRDSKILYDEFKDIKQDQFMGVAAFAVIDKDVRKCSGITDTRHKDLCYEYAYQVLVDECNSESGAKLRSCVREVSWGLPSMEDQRLFCHYIDDEQAYNECRGTTDIKACDEIENEEKALLCQINIARVRGTIDTCKEIAQTDNKDVCYAILGADNLEESYCDMAKDEYASGQCKLKIAIVSNDLKICENIEHIESKDICYGHFVLNKKTVSRAMCNDINEEFIKDMCELVLAVEEKNTNKCNSYTGDDELNQALCYFAMATKHEDANFCPKIITTSEEELLFVEKKYKDTCYIDIAIKLSDIKMCEKVENHSSKQGCVDAVGKPEIKEEPEVAFPTLPESMADCPITEGAEFKIWDNGQSTGYKYVDPKLSRRIIGPSIAYWGSDHSQPYRFICYNSEGDKHGPFQEFRQEGGDIDIEGHYKNGKYDQVITDYITEDHLRTITTYTEGVKNGPITRYCPTEAHNSKCTFGELIQTGFYTNNKRSGFWKSYSKGEFTYKEEFINGEVTRDKSGMNIRYYTE